MDNEVRHTASRARFDRQGRRLLVLGIGVLAVLVSATVLALKDLGAVVVRLVEQGTPVWALGVFVFAVFAGIAKIVSSFSEPMSRVVRIVELRRAAGDDPGRDA
ncbi:hypothetical protein AB0H12_44295 [Actinosynnema sp. NPDC023794]